MSAKRALRAFRAPDERAAEERAWGVVRAAYREGVPVRRRRARRPLMLAVGIAVLIGASLSPAGATVGGLITHALGVRHAARALSSLPAPGRLLVSGPGGTWTIGPDGSAHRLGPWEQASYSPHGLYVSVGTPNLLEVVDPRGVMQWSLERPAVSDPRWFAPSGYRVAYLSHGDLRAVAGDRSGDHLVATRVAPVAPAWRPGHAYQLAYVSAGRRLVVVDADSGATVWSARPAQAVRKLVWSEDGRRLLVLSARAAALYTPGRPLRVTPLSIAHAPVIDGALAASGQAVALVLAGANSDAVAVATVSGRRTVVRRVFAGAGLRQIVWSPDGRWLLVTWPAADQWVFVRVQGRPQITAVSGIARRYDRRRGFPRLDGWCCTARGAAG